VRGAWSGRLVLLIVVGLVTACGPLAPPLLSGVQPGPPAPSPQQRTQQNRLAVRYHLGRPASLAAYAVSADGQQFTLHDAASRPSAGDYVLQFDGTVAGPGPNERRVLPDGDYQIVLDARDGASQQQARVPLAIRGADTSLPDVQNLVLLPDHISPNFDADQDLTRVTYVVSKASAVQPFLDRVAADGTRERVWMGSEQAVDTGAQSLTWDGLGNNGQPVASGDYEFGIHARDAAGNEIERAQPLVVDDSGVPDASIITARIGPLEISRGSPVCLDAVVRNTGQTTLRTQGPDPSYVYNSFDSYSNIEDHRYIEHAGLWRVGLNWSGSTDTSNATYPYRWGFGKDLEPGEEVAIHVCVNVFNEQDQIVLFAALVQENVSLRSAGAGLVRVKVSS
jgi:hypothetical protein